MSFAKQQKRLEALLLPLDKYFHNDFSQIKWGNRQVVYSQDTVGIEGLARALWGLAPYFANDSIIKNPQMQILLDKILQGIKQGTDKNSKNYWGDIGDFDQRYVEMAALAYFLLLNKKIVEQNFDQQQKQNLQNWLLQINQANFSKNNWQFFKILVNMALKKLALKYSHGAMESAFINIEAAYIGSGWYCDGRIGQRDYYIAFGYHFYSLIYCQFAENKARKKILLTRSKKFLEDFLNFYDQKGRSIPYGRSLIYRFAPLGFLSYALIHNLVPRLNSQIKAIIDKNLHYWFKQCKITDKDHKLNLGYCYENHNFLEEYNSNTSVNWALKAFAFMQLPKTNAFWNIKPEFSEVLDIKILKSPKFIIVNNSNSKTLINSGQWAMFNPKYNVEKYTKHLYNSNYGFCVRQDESKYANLNADNQLVIENQKKFLFPTEVKLGKIIKQKVCSHYFYGSDFEVKTVQSTVGNYIKREHTIISKVQTWGYDASFSYPTNETNWKKFIQPKVSKTNKFYSTNQDLLVYKQANTPKSNLVSPLTYIYYVRFPIKVGITKICFYIKI